MLLSSTRALAQQPTTQTLMISAQSLISEPIAGVRMKHVFEGEETAFATNEFGTVRVTVRRDPEIRDGSDLEVVDPRFRVLRATERSGNGRGRASRFVSFQLYRTDSERMSPAERHQYILAMPEILARNRETTATLPGDAGTPNALRLSAFLEGFRQETSISVEEMKSRIEREMEPPLELEVVPQAPLLRAVVVDAHGGRVAGRPVLLFTLEEETGLLLPTANRRTDERGEVYFDELETGRLYRMEVPSQGDNMVARGPILRLEKGHTINFPPLILRQRGRTLSGIVFYKDRPLANAEISVVGRPSFLSVTDRFGYFQLGPFELEEEAMLRFRLPGGSTAQFLAPVGERELFIPVDLLAAEN